MISAVSPRRFAQAVFEIAVGAGQVELWVSDLEELVSISKDPTVLAFMDSPKFSLDDKMSVIKDSSVSSDLNQLAINLLFLLASKNSVHVIKDIAEAFQKLVDEHNGVLRAEIVTATEISQEAAKTISETLKQISGNNLTVTRKTDPSIVGGFIAKIGDRMIDASIKTRLENMKRYLVKGV